MIFNDETPIIVVVENGRYECYSTHPEPTTRDEWLMATLKGMGGVNENVAEGRHHFNVVLRNRKIEASLLPIEE